MFEIQSKKIIFTLLFVSCFLFSAVASTETIVCEGNLKDINGNSVNKTIKMSFSINSTKGEKLWEIEKYINFKNAHFFTILGKMNPISPELLNSKNNLQVGLVCDDQIHIISSNELASNKISIESVIIPCFIYKNKSLCTIHKDKENKPNKKMICQGQLNDLTGEPINQTFKMFFTIKEKIGHELWKREKFVTFTNGSFKTILGQTKPITSEYINQNKTLDIGIRCSDGKIHSIANNALTTAQTNKPSDNSQSNNHTNLRQNKEVDLPEKLKHSKNLNNALLPALSKASSSTFYVPRDFKTIQDAIDASEDGDTVIIMDGTYSGEGNVNINFNGKNIFVYSESGPDNCFIECGENCQNVFVINKGEYVELGGIAIKMKEGYEFENDPCGILIEKSSADIFGINFSIYTSIVIKNEDYQGTINVQDCNFTLQDKSGSAGIIAENSSAIKIQDCHFSSEYWGSGIIIENSSPHINGCSFIYTEACSWCDNYAISILGDSVADIEECHFNRSNINIDNSTPTFNNCDFEESEIKILTSSSSTFNESDFVNGNLKFWDSSTSIIENCNFMKYDIDCRNDSTSIFKNCKISNCDSWNPFFKVFDYASINITGSIISENLGGIWYYSKADSIIEDTIISNNTNGRLAPNFFHIGPSRSTNVALGCLSINNCNISGNSGRDAGGVVILNASANISKCSFFKNKGVIAGGLLCYNNSQVNISDCEIYENKGVYGGGLYIESNYSSSINISACKISKNISSYGGGIFCYNSQPSISNCLIQENNGGHFGGGLLCVYFSQPSLNNCTIENNIATNGENTFYLNSKTTTTNNYGYPNPLTKKSAYVLKPYYKMMGTTINDFFECENTKRRNNIQKRKYNQYKHYNRLIRKYTAKPISQSSISNLNILSPTSLVPEFCGKHDRPHLVSIAFEMTSENNVFVSNLQIDNIEIKIGNENAICVTSIELSDRYIINVLPPVQTNLGIYDLTLSVNGETDIENNAIQYDKISQSNIDTVLTLDRSGSMAEYGYMEPAKNALNIFIDHLQTDDMLGIVSFAYYTSLNYGISKIFDQDTKKESQTVVNLIPSFGGTGMGAGLLEAQKLLLRGGSNMHQWSIILMSDGKENESPYSFDVLPDILKTKTKIFTIALGNRSDTELLQQIALQTGGQYYYSPDEIQLSAIYSALVNQVAGRQTLFSESLSITESTVMRKTIPIDSSVEEAIFSITWDNSDKELDIALQDPEEKIIDENISDLNITFTKSSTSKVITIKSPTPGDWIMTINESIVKKHVNISSLTNNATSDSIKSNINVTAHSTLQLNTYLDKKKYYLGVDSLRIIVAISDTLQPIIGATVTAVPSNVSPSELLILYDDGEHKDGKPNDGVYANSINKYRSSPIYINATGTNTRGYKFVRKDNITASVDSPYLVLDLPKKVIEGDGLLKNAGVVSIPTVLSYDLLIHIDIEDEYSDISVPKTVVIPSGQQSKSFDITVADDSENGYAIIEISAEGWGYESKEIDIIHLWEDVLILSIPKEVSEGNNILNNSGKISIPSVHYDDLIVNLSSNYTSIVNVPENVTIPSGKSSAFFDIEILGNVNKSTNIEIKASSEGWESDSEEITILDTYETILYISIANEATEGDGILEGTISISEEYSTDLKVNLSSSDTPAVKVPEMVTIPVGQNSVKFELIIADKISETKTVKILASAIGWTSGSDFIQVKKAFEQDKVLYVSVPNEATEGDGVLEGTISISQTYSSNLHVNLTASDALAVKIPETLTIPIGQNSAKFELIIADNISETKSVTILASAHGWSSGSDIIQVKKALEEDNVLTLEIPERVNENDGILQGKISVSGKLYEKLIIHLTSSNSSYVKVPEMVTIDVFNTSATFDISIIDNNNYTKNNTVMITASADGWKSDSSQIVVIDNDKDGDELCFISITKNWNNGIINFLKLLSLLLLFVSGLLYRKQYQSFF